MKAQQLQKISFFRFFSVPELQLALNRNEIILQRYHKGHIIHFESDLCETIEIVYDGVIDSIRIDEQGNTFRIASFNRFESIGGALIFSSKPYYPMTVIASKDVALIEVNKMFLDRALTNKDFLFFYLNAISDLALELSNKIKNHVHKSIRENLLQFIKKECLKNNTNHMVLRISKKQLAENLGIQRTSLSRELKKMVDDQLIIMDGKTIILCQ